MKLEISGYEETSWIDEGKSIRGNHTIIYSGGEKHINGADIGMKIKFMKSVGTTELHYSKKKRYHVLGKYA